MTTFSLVLLSLAWFLLVEWDNPFLFKGADVRRGCVTGSSRR